MASLPTTQRAWTIGQLPTGPITADTFKLTTTNLPELADNQVLLRVEYFSNDPVVRQRILALSPGDIVGCWAVASVLASKAPQWVQGDRVFGELGWYDVGVVDASKIKSRAA
jgi:NADPH-dependent curcumin reductase CurA